VPDGETMPKRLHGLNKYQRAARNIYVRTDLDTTVPCGDHPRPVLICRSCAEAPATSSKVTY
jgi:hypothetical protein